MSDDQKILQDAGIDVEQTNSAILIMSRTGGGKSSLLATYFRYVWNEYKKRSLLYLFDGGGIPMEMQALVYAGVVYLFRARTRDPYGQGLMWDTVIKSCQGWWPMKIKPKSGEAEPGCAMMPPAEVLYNIYCPNGHSIAKVSHANQLHGGMCGVAGCGAIVNEMNWKVKPETIVNPFFKDIGARGYDSLTQMLAWGEEDLAQRAGRDDLKGLEGAIGGKIISGDQKLGQTTMSHIGFAQQQARSLVLMSNGIPGMVVPPAFTALLLEATAEGMRVAGPELSGRKKTTVAGAWFGNVWEPEKIVVGKDLQGRATHQFILHLEQWTDNEGVTHLCKNRAAPGYLPATLVDPPLTNTEADKKTAFTNFNLGVAFTLLDAALTQRIKDAQVEFGVMKPVESEYVEYARPETNVPSAGPVVGMPMVPGMVPGQPHPMMPITPHPPLSGVVPFSIGPATPQMAPQLIAPAAVATITPFVPTAGPGAPLATMPTPKLPTPNIGTAPTTVQPSVLPPPVMPTPVPPTTAAPLPPPANIHIAAPPGRLPPPAVPIPAPIPPK